MRRTVLMNVRACAGSVLLLLLLTLNGPGLNGARQSSNAQNELWNVPSRAARTRNPVDADGKVIAQAKRLYTKECLPCHGPSGKGDGSKAPDLKVDPGDLSSGAVLGQTDGELFWKITHGRTPMPAYRSFSAEDRWNLVHYLRTLGVESAGAQAAAPNPVEPDRAATAPQTDSAPKPIATREAEKDRSSADPPLQPARQPILAEEPAVAAEPEAAQAETIPDPGPGSFVSRREYETLKGEHEELKLEIQTLKLLLQGAGKTEEPQPAAPEVREVQESVGELQEDLRDLEASIEEMQGRVALSSAGSTRHLLTGFAFAGFAGGRGRDSVFSAGFSPIFLWQLSERILFESELKLGLEGDDTDVDLDRAQIYYVVNDYMTLGAGKFLSPMNFLEDRLHQVTKLPDNPLPIQQLLPRRNVGLQLRGAIPIRATRLDYAFYVANAPAIEAEDPAGLGRLQFDHFAQFDNRVAIGGRVGFFPIPELQAGYGFQFSGVKLGGQNADALLHSVDLNYVRDSRALRGTINLLAQWAWSDVGAMTFDPEGRLGFGPVELNNRRDGGYVQLAYRPTMAANDALRRMEPVLRYERFNQKKTPARFEQERWTVGLNYWLLPSAVIKTAYQFDDRDRDAFLLQFKIGF